MMRAAPDGIPGYQLEEVIGSSAAAVVYRARQPQLDRWVAIKVFDVADSNGVRFLERFREGIQAVAGLHHPNILNIHDYGEAQGMVYVVMEYVTGGSLARCLKEAAVPIYDALTLSLAIGEALAYAGAREIVHGSVKPSNILLPRPDWPLIADFGMVAGVNRRSGVLQSSIISDTVSYLSPEQVLGEEVDARTDIYSLGLVLYELVTGAPPFADRSVAQSMMRRLHEPPSSPRDQNPEVSEALEMVLLRAISPDADARYAHMQSFVNDLRRVRAAYRASGDVRDGVSWDREAGASTVGTMPADVLSAPQGAANPTSEAGQTITMRLLHHPEITGPRLFIATTGVALPLPNLETVRIGRQDPLTAQVPDLDLEPYGGGSAGVSRQHACFLKRPDGWYIEDLRSTNGTFLNEVRLLPHRPIRIRSGDLLRFAQLTLLYEE